MENKAQRKVLIIIGIILVLIAISAYILSLFIKEDSSDPDTPSVEPEPNESADTFQDRIVRLEDESLFFSVQKVINDYYNSIFEEDTRTLLSVLDPLYKEDNQIIGNNIYAIIGSDYGITNYVAKEIYYNPDSSVTYYFVSGNLTSNSIMGDEYEFLEDVCFLIIVDESNSNYILRPIDTSDLFSYAEDYNMVEREVESGATFVEVEVTEANKLSNYLAIFINFLIDNPEEAYNLLDNETKNNYQNYSDFLSQVVDLYQNLSSKVFSYSSEEEDDRVVYEVVDDNQNKITIYEYHIMDFQISY